MAAVATDEAARQVGANAKRVIVGSLAQVTPHSRDVTSQERGQDRVKNDRRPKKDPAQTCETKVSQIQRDGSAVDQHASKRRTRPAGDPQSNQGDAGHARYRNCDAGKLLT